eukprot:scaffold4518_cov149-Cylindrotheca_fusiformis.AAC.3
MADSSEDDKLDYIKKEYFDEGAKPWFGHPPADDKSVGEDSSNLFMSEPSTSEADSSEQRMRLLSPLGSLSADSNDEPFLPPAQPRPARLLNMPAPGSPGNTSLSSWESPHLDGRQVHIHFTPDRTKRGTQPSPLSFDAGARPSVPAGAIPLRDNKNQMALSNDAKPAGRGIASQQSSNSTSDGSDGRKKQLEVFLDDLRFQSHGKVKEQSAANMSFDSSFKGQNKVKNPEEIIRSKTGMPLQCHTSGVDTTVAQNTSESIEGLSVPTLPLELQQNSNHPTDASTVMVFSASEDESSEGLSRPTHMDPLASTDHDPGADEEAASKEIKTERQRRARNGHRRQRSGDAAAATLSTGSKEWKGMEQDKIPMPPSPREYDDDGDEFQKKRRAKGRNGAAAPKNSNTRNGINANDSPRGNEETQAFSLGASSGREKITRRDSRSQRQDSRARYNMPGFHQSPVKSASPSRRSQVARESGDGRERSSFFGLYGAPNVRRSFDMASPHSHYRRSTYANAGELYSQGFCFGSPEGTAPLSPSTRQSPRQDTYSLYRHSLGNIPLSDSGGFRRSVLEQWPPPNHPMIEVPDLLNAATPEALGGVRFENPELMRSSRTSPFATVGMKMGPKIDRRNFLPQISATVDEKNCPTYICPVCKTRQREFFTVTSAPRQFESPSGYIALYFSVYVVAALYIFGLQEGWGKLDCFYFAVITLTTAGLGDFVPTSDGAKVICSIFIYFGVACIGLLLGSYIAGMLDETSSRKAMANRIKACPNCTRIQNIKDEAERRAKAYRKGRREAKTQNFIDQARLYQSEASPSEPTTKKSKHGHRSVPATKDLIQSERPGGVERASPTITGAKSTKSPPLVPSPRGSAERKSSPPMPHSLPSNMMSPITQKRVLGSPMTSEILGRQSHTRHASFDVGQFAGASGGAQAPRPRADKSSTPGRVRGASVTTQTLQPEQPVLDPATFNEMYSAYSSDDDSVDLTESSSETQQIGREKKYSSVKNAKYVFLTLREALLNSMVIIAFGCMGFYFIEGFSLVDSKFLAIHLHFLLFPNLIHV